MTAESENLPPDLVISQLRKSGIVGSAEAVEMQSLPRNPGRLDYASRRAFRVSAGQKAVCYLLTGPNLAGVAGRAREFAESCPDLAAKELFFLQTPTADFLGLEFIEGSPLDKSTEPAPVLAKAATVVFEGLERTLKPSSTAELGAELEAFFVCVLACPLFGAIGSGYLTDVIFPWMREETSRLPPQTRWTNGDFTAHNVIVDRQGRVRLIDYEYAHRTHFHLEDLVRWRTYSTVQPHVFDPRLPVTPPWLEAFFLLRQTVLECEIANSRIALNGAKERILRLRQLAAEAPGQFRSGAGPTPEPTLQAAEKRISELKDRIARTEENFHNLEGQMAQAQSLVAKLMAELEEKVRSNEEKHLRCADLDDKVRRMQDSFSWRITAPIRALRRLFLDRK